MTLLLDTHVVLWAMVDPDQLSKRATQAIKKTERVISVASIWEVAIKHAAGRLDLGDELTPKTFFDRVEQALRCAILNIERDHVLVAGRLPFHHKDPFDRVLAAQAQTGDLSIVSSDPVFDRYGVERIW